MDGTAKYLIHADVSAAGVVDRTDVVGAVYGQTEGLLGDTLDISDLQQSAKLSRIDVEIESEGGNSYGHLTVASNLDRVETAVFAAALETIDRVGPCEARIEVTDIEDARAARREQVVDRAAELLDTAFDEGALTGEELVERVRESVRVADVTEYAGQPAGPRVAEGDAVIVVEGRSDVRTLLRYGVKNAVAIEGTNVPEAVADLTTERTATAFLDGDRGGDLILRELAQVADVDYVARAPDGQCVEDLSRDAVRAALSQKVPIEVGLDRLDEDRDRTDDGGDDEADADDPTADEAPESDTGDDEDDATPTPTTLADHATAVRDAGGVRLVDVDGSLLGSADGDPAEVVLEADDAPHAVVVDGPVTQRLLDVASQRGVGVVVGSERGEFTKQPVGVQVRTLGDVRA